MTDERTIDEEGTDLGGFLKKVRQSRGLSLREVERLTDGTVSNGYLSQLENGNIDKPSAMMLHRLSNAYKLDYHEIMKRAGFLTEASRRGATLAKMQEVSRHKKVEVLLGYVRSAALFEDHAGAEFL